MAVAEKVAVSPGATVLLAGFVTIVGGVAGDEGGGAVGAMPPHNPPRPQSGSTTGTLQHKPTDAWMADSPKDVTEDRALDS